MLQSVASAKGALHENLTKMQGTVSGSVQTYSVQFQKETETMQTSATEGMLGVLKCVVHMLMLDQLSTDNRGRSAHGWRPRSR